MSVAFHRARLASTESLIVVYEDAVSALVTGGFQEYRLDTGQTITNVTKFDVAALQRTLDSLYNRQSTLSARVGGGSILVRPVF